MSTKYVPPGILVLLSFFSLLASGQCGGRDIAGQAIQDARVAKINLEEVLVSTRDGKKILGDVQKQFASRESGLKKQNEEIVKQKQKLADETSKLSDTEREKRKAALGEKERKLEESYNSWQSEQQQAESQAIRTQGLKVIAILQKYAKAKNYAVILDVSSSEVADVWASEETVRALGLFGKPEAETAKSLLAAFGAKDGPLVTKELIAACDSEKN